MKEEEATWDSEVGWPFILGGILTEQGPLARSLTLLHWIIPMPKVEGAEVVGEVHRIIDEQQSYSPFKALVISVLVVCTMRPTGLTPSPALRRTQVSGNGFWYQQSLAFRAILA